ncbi:MAG: hypothetical protein K0Q53_2777 [Massilibacillus sp.]|jgi:hypothetical protein|nr:hypothetical protein [Massilibacillus sp.]
MPIDVANAALYLATDEASFVTQILQDGMWMGKKYSMSRIVGGELTANI